MKLTIHGITPAWQRANAKAAAAYRAGVRAVALDDRHYAVRAATEDHAYTVTVQSVSRLLSTCDCRAGQCGRVCYHQSLAMSAAAERIRQYTAQQPAPVAAPERTATRMTGEEAARRMQRAFAA